MTFTHKFGMAACAVLATATTGLSATVSAEADVVSGRYPVITGRSRAARSRL
ncbi:MAG: hypothetical protein IJ678_05545 [Kiritimatiellae bacterium]|nr:hypothetical protein [Kiritimatiellia bacterium]MBR1836313.1 hypothetical protein [Kiritimatiellia bacterium]